MFQLMAKYSVFLVLLLSASAYALPCDKEKIMQVKADSADLNQHAHKGIYTGNVELVQGSTNLHANKAITLGNEENQLVLATAHGTNGNQAHYWTMTDIQKPPLHAYADTIRYYPLRHLIELIGNARVEQGSNSFTASKISYDTLNKHVLSEGQGKERITIIYHPEKKPS